MRGGEVWTDAVIWTAYTNVLSARIERLVVSAKGSKSLLSSFIAAHRTKTPPPLNGAKTLSRRERDRCSGEIQAGNSSDLGAQPLGHRLVCVEVFATKFGHFRFAEFLRGADQGGVGAHLQSSRGVIG